MQLFVYFLLHIDREVEKHIPNASKAFGALRQAVFKDKNIIISIKRLIYQGCVISVYCMGLSTVYHFENILRD